MLSKTKCDACGSKTNNLVECNCCGTRTCAGTSTVSPCPCACEAAFAAVNPDVEKARRALMALTVEDGVGTTLQAAAERELRKIEGAIYLQYGS